MNLKAKINNDFKDALLSKDKMKSETLKLIKSEIKNREILNKTSDLSDVEIVGLLQKEAKKRSEMIEVYGKNNREDLVKNEQVEFDIISAYLPKTIGDDELGTLILSIKVDGDKMGDLIRKTKEAVSNRNLTVDGRKLADIVKQYL